MIGMVAIRPFVTADREAVLDLSLRCWGPVFGLLEPAVPAFVYEAFYPRGWEARQLTDLAAVLDNEPQNVDLAVDAGGVAGWVCTRLHPEDRMGEVYVLAVDPQRQRQGVGTALMDYAFHRARQAGMSMMMVETGDDPGHAPARAAYVAAGFERWPVARYFRPLV